MNTELRMKLAANGHVVHATRNSYTHAAFAKNLSPDTTIKQDDRKVWNRWLGRYVTVGDLLPERVALALDDHGSILPQMEFDRNYIAYLNGFGLAKRDPALEPCPEVYRYLLTSVDPAFPAQDGRFVELGFDVNSTQVPMEEPLVVPTEAVALDIAPAQEVAPEMALAPCGKEVKKRGLHMHKMRCGQIECAALREAH